MIAAVLVLVSAYFAIRVALMELFQNLKSVYQKWEDRTAPKLENYNSSASKDILPSHPVMGEDQTYEFQKNSGDGKNSLLGTTSDLKPKRQGHWNHSRQPNGSRAKFPALALSHWDQQLAHFKMAPSIHPDISALRPMVGAACSRCVPTSRLAFSDESASRLGIYNMLTLSYARDGGLLARAYDHFNFVFQRNAVNEYADVTKKVLHSERVSQAVKRAAQEELEEENLDSSYMVLFQQRHNERALEALRRMRSCISNVLLRLAKWVLYKLFVRLLNGIHIHKGQFEVLRKVSERKLPVVYLPLHRSHLDYILVTYLLTVNGLRAPLIAAGDNLLIPFFGALMRGLGAFFIKRKLDPKKGRKDHVYRAVLHTYMSECLSAGHSLEFFLEGGRSRSGKACMPKGGLLSVVVDAIADGVVEDAFIVPVAISYEKILDGNFVLEQLGKPKAVESFASAVKAIWSTLHSNFGNVRVDFCQPFSLKEFLQSYKRSQPTAGQIKISSPLNGSSLLSSCPIRRSSSSTSLYGTDVVIEDQRQFVKELAEHVVYDASNSKALMSTNLLAFLLLNKYRKGATLQQLTHSFNQLREELSQKKCDVGFSGDSVDAVRYAWSLLGKELVTTETIQMEWSLRDMESNMKIVFYKPNVRLPYVLELQYYSNALLSVYLMESIVANALFAALDDEVENWQGCKSLLSISREQLLSKALDLCDILQYEFIFAPPCTDLTNVIMETIQQLITSENLSVLGSAYPSSQGGTSRSWANTLEANLDGSDDDEDLMPVDVKLKVNLNEDSFSRLQFLRCILSPYIETYWLSACSLVKLVGTQKEENLYFQLHHKMAEDRLHQGLLSYEESFAAEPLKNSLRLFEHWGVLENFYQDSVRLLYLKPAYDSEESLQEVVARIEEFKK